MSNPTLPPVEIVAEAAQLWNASLQPAGCPSCRSGFLLASEPTSQRCPVCWRVNLEPQPARLRSEPPELVIPFPKSPRDYLNQAQKFVQPVWLRPDDLKAEHLIQRLVPLYLPHWLVDGRLRGDWQAKVGYDYQVQSSQERYAGNGWQVQKVVETRIRWESRLGQIERSYENLLAPAVSTAAELRKCIGEPNPKEGHPFAPALIQGAILRIPDLPPESAWPIVRARFDQAASNSCMQAAGGQHIEQFNINATYTDLNWTQLLQPYYTTVYQDDDGRLHTIVLNPFKGEFFGPRLASLRKAWTISGISAVVALALFIIGALLLAGTAIAPPLSVLGILAIILGVGAAIFALVPVIWAWNWNRQQVIPAQN